MLHLIFQLGDDRYALATDRVVEVLPLLHWKELPQAAPGVAGVLDYHGLPVPLIDLSAMAFGRLSRGVMSTRIVLVEYPFGEEPLRETHILGLLAEQAMTTIRLFPENFNDAGVAVEDAPYLGPVATDEKGIIQQIEVEKLLTQEVKNLLFRPVLEPV